MSTKLRKALKAGTEVVVIAGADRGKRGKVVSVNREKEVVVVEGINQRRKHVKRSQTNPEGGIQDKDCPIHMSNVMMAEEYDARHAQGGTR